MPSLHADDSIVMAFRSIESWRNEESFSSRQWHWKAKSARGDQFFPEIFVQKSFAEKIGFSRRRRGGFGLERQADGKFRSLTGLALRLDFAAVMVDDEKTGHQMNAIFGRDAALHDERIE